LAKLPVTAGSRPTAATNGKVTEILSGGLKDGTEVITEAASTAP